MKKMMLLGLAWCCMVLSAYGAQRYGDYWPVEDKTRIGYYAKHHLGKEGYLDMTRADLDRFMAMKMEWEKNTKILRNVLRNDTYNLCEIESLVAAGICPDTAEASYNLLFCFKEGLEKPAHRHAVCPTKVLLWLLKAGCNPLVQTRNYDRTTVSYEPFVEVIERTDDHDPFKEDILNTIKKCQKAFETREKEIYQANDTDFNNFAAVCGFSTSTNRGTQADTTQDKSTQTEPELLVKQ